MPFETVLESGKLPEGRSGFFRLDRQFVFVDPYDLVARSNQLLEDHGLSRSFSTLQNKDPNSVYTGQLITVEDLVYVSTDLVGSLDFEERRVQELARSQTIKILREDYPLYRVPRTLRGFITLAREITPEYSSLS